MKNNKDLNDILEGINAIAKEQNVQLLLLNQILRDYILK